MSEELIKNFTQLSKGGAAIAGGKGASLGEMTQAGISVPPGFVILSDAFERFLEETDLNAEIDAALHSVNREEMHTVEHASATIQQLILQAKMPEDIAKEIEREFAKLGTGFVAVRSSATAEDSASAAWAGQLDSFLNTTEDSLLQNVQRCWASLFTPRAIFYRFEKDLHLTKISVAVVVQKMVESECSGIAFSVHPVTEDYNQLIIEAGFGLGEAIVSGQVTPDSYVVEKTPRRIIDINISTQTRQLIRSNNKVDEPNAWVEIPEPQASSQVLSEAKILELSELVLKIENHYGFPCDIEWAFEANTFYIVQSRPITTLSPVVANFQSNLAFLKPENFSYVGLYKSPPFSLWFWSAWYQKDLADELNVPHEPDIYFGFKGGHTFTRNSSEAEFRDVVTERVNRGDISYFKNLCGALEREAKTAVAFAATLEGHPITHEEFDRLVYWGRRLLFFCFVAWQNSQQFDPLFKRAAAEEGINKDMVGDYIPAPRTLLTQQHEESLQLKAILEQKGLWELLKQDSSQAIKAIRSDSKIWPLVEAHLKKFEWLNLMNWIGDKLSLEKLLEQMTLMSSSTNSGSPVVSTAFEKYVSIATEVAHLRNAGVEQLSIFTNKVMPALMELAKRGGVSYRDLLLLMPTEVFKDGQRALDWQEKISRRQNDNWCIYNDSTGAIKIEDDVPSIEEIAERFLPKYKKDICDGLRGQIGNKGKAVGPVRVIIATDDFHKMQTGDVLVTPMTTPDFVLLMQKSAAIVTDMGGLLCHAAIVSRELNKPCVIDTKFATQVLKDGDLVEVDANQGVVTILERATI